MWALISVLVPGYLAAPNVIIILVDDLGSSDVSFSARRLVGDAAIETPALDSLALGNGGIQLTRSYTHNICGPSRTALISGRLAHTLGNPFPMVEGGSMPKGIKTVAHEFLARGYATDFIGKHTHFSVEVHGTFMFRALMPACR